MHSIVVENGCSWDSPIVICCNTGKILYGNDYYQNMMLWTLPVAIMGGNLANLCHQGGLVDRLLQAARKGMAASDHVVQNTTQAEELSTRPTV